MCSSPGVFLPPVHGVNHQGQLLHVVWCPPSKDNQDVSANAEAKTSKIYSRQTLIHCANIWMDTAGFPNIFNVTWSLSSHACLKAVFNLSQGFQLILYFWSYYLIICNFYFLLWFMGSIYASVATFSCSVDKSLCSLSDLMSSLPCLQGIKTATTLLHMQNNWMRCLLLGGYFSFTDFPILLHFTASTFILAE